MRYNNESTDRAGYDGVFKAMGDEHRLQILELLAKKELSAGEILESLDIVQSTLSHHMKVLTESGVVTAKRNGKWTIYSVNTEVVKDASAYLDVFLKEASHAEKAEVVRRGGAARNAVRAAEEKAAGEKSAAERKAAEVKSAAEKKAAEVKSAAERKSAEAKAAAERKAAEEDDTRAGEDPASRQSASDGAAGKKKGKKGKKAKKNGKK